MILQSLTEYYEALARRGELARPGWGSAKISFALELSPNGELLSVLPLFVTVQDKKKTVQRPREFPAPAAVKRSGRRIAPNFLWDNAAYMTGFPKADEEKEVVNARERFEAMREYHLRLLADCHSEIAHAIVSYFQNWNPAEAAVHPMLAPFGKELAGGANLTFYCGGVYAVKEPEMAQVWQSQYDGEEGETSVCLVTGKAGVPQAVHPPVKGLYGAQTCAAIVSFNADAFTSYGKKQSLNAPVSKYAAFAYTEALNYLLKEPHCHKRIGDTTYAYWAEDADPGGSDFLSAWYDSDDSETMGQEDMDYVLRRLASGLPVDREGLSIQPDNHFYILALAPNTARVSVRFFLTDTFGHLAKNLLRHYARMEIVGAKPMITVWQMVKATVRAKKGKSGGKDDKSGGKDDKTSQKEDKTIDPHLTGDLIRAILEGSRYPDTLYQRLILRIRTEQTITPTRAALIKAYLLNNECMTHKIYEEVLTVKLNEETTYLPYVLGELFALLEEIQKKASGVTTIKDRFYTSACTTPAVVFPRVIDLAEKHLKKLKKQDKPMPDFSKELNRLIGMMDESFPAHLSLQDQGVFQIGYYHKKKRFEKKDAAGN